MNSVRPASRSAFRYLAVDRGVFLRGVAHDSNPVPVHTMQSPWCWPFSGGGPGVRAPGRPDDVVAACRRRARMKSSATRGVSHRAGVWPRHDSCHTPAWSRCGAFQCSGGACVRPTRTEGWASGSWQALGRAVEVVVLDEDGEAWVPVAAPDREFRRILVEGKGTDVDGAGESGVQAEDEPVGEAVVDEESQSGAGVFILA